MSRVWVVLWVGVMAGGPAPPSSSPTGTRPTSRPHQGDHIVIYKPGVGINWTQRQVELTGKVALREGALELFACATDVYGGDKTHESIVLLHARPLHVYQALGLIGLRPGRPAQWNPKTEKLIPATGQPLELRVEWLDDGVRRQVDVCEWMQREKGPAKRLEPLPWVFAGSGPRPEGGILADEDGTVATVVDFDGSIICLSELHPSDYSQLWIAARTKAVPQLDMPCTLIVRAAALRLSMDRFGRITLDRRQLDPDAVVKEVRRYLKGRADGLVIILVAPTALKADVDALRQHLRKAGIADKAVEIHRRPASSFPADDPAAGKAFLRDQLSGQGSLADSAREGQRRLVSQLTSRQSAFERRFSAVADYVRRVRDGLDYLAADTPASPTTGPVGPPMHPLPTTVPQR